MKRNEINDALEPLINAFDELGILYYVGGSVASSAYGTARTTLDVDVVLNILPSHIKPLVDKLKDKYYIDAEMIADAIKSRSSFNLIHTQTMIKIDCFILKDQPYSKASFERKRKDKLEELPDAISVYLCSPEDIILNKLEWFKMGGEVSERQWSDILGVIKIQSETLDREYLKTWAKELNVFSLLEKAFIECGVEL